VLALISAPTNLGLRPPQPGAVPGTAKAPEALREAGLYARFAALGAVDAGVVLPGRYLDDARPGVPRSRNQDAVLDHAGRLAARIAGQLDAARVPLILGGDCSLLIAAGQALSSRGRYGLVHLDGHRHPGNSNECFSLAGEDLAAAVGLHWPAITGGRPYFRPADTVHLGCRDDDEHLAEASGILAQVIPATQARADSITAAATATQARADSITAAATAIQATVGASHLDGYWLHLDVDILDPAMMPAVDSPADGGLTPAELTGLLAALAPRAAGAQVTVFDPDLDPDGRCAALLTDILTSGLKHLGQAAPIAVPGRGCRHDVRSRPT
jgi:arginase